MPLFLDEEKEQRERQMKELKILITRAYNGYILNINHSPMCEIFLSKKELLPRLEFVVDAFCEGRLLEDE